MISIKEKLQNKVDEAIALGYFKSFCERYSSAKEKQRLRNILMRSTNHRMSIASIFKNEHDVILSETECDRMVELIKAFLNKSTYRKNIETDEKNTLLFSQANHCAICMGRIDVHAHTDHIVPFKYVGDELENNLQMLCSHCNLQKNASIDYQIKCLLRLI